MAQVVHEFINADSAVENWLSINVSFDDAVVAVGYGEDYLGFYMTPEQGRELARHLTDWADRVG